MAEAYSREEQNNILLSDLASKSHSLRSLTEQIHGQSTSSNVLVGDTTESFSNMSTSIRGSAARLTRSARQGDRVAVVKVVGIVVVSGVVVWWVGGWLLGWLFGR